MKMQDHIAKAIQLADIEQVPEGFADTAGYEGNAWISDWSAYLAHRVIHELAVAGFAVVPAVLPSGNEK